MNAIGAIFMNYFLATNDAKLLMTKTTHNNEILSHCLKSLVNLFNPFIYGRMFKKSNYFSIDQKQKKPPPFLLYG